MKDFNKMSWAAVVLAAGKGTRMKSDLPKVLHEVAGKPMVSRVLEAVRATGIRNLILVIGGEVEKFDEIFGAYPDIAVALQADRKGTADAVASGGYGIEGFSLPPYAAGKLLRGKPLAVDYLLICTGDTPCLSASTLDTFVQQGIESGCPLGVVGMIHPQPTGYGRLVLDQEERLQKIVEEKDASAAEKAINLCNSGIIYCRKDLLAQVLSRLTNENQSGEYYLTDLFQEAARLGQKAFVYQTENYHEFDGVNTPQQLNKVADWLKSKGRA